MTLAKTLVHDRLSTLADPTRGRILLVLEQHELTVGELCSVLGLPQSTVSRHLRVLNDDRWVASRQEGTSGTTQRKPTWNRRPGGCGNWLVTTRAGATWVHDRQRLEGVIEQRRAKSRAFFAGSAVGAEWDRLREELFGGQGGAMALLGLLMKDGRWATLVVERGT